MNLIKNLLEKNKKLHLTLIDPENQTPQEAGKRAAECESYGTDAIMIGGSTIRDRSIVHETVKEIKNATNLPTILFPNSAESLSANADYVFFMMLMNSRDQRLLLGEQMKGAPFIRTNSIKPVSMGYIVISMSEAPTTVEKVANIDRISANDIEKARDYATTAEYLNMECIYLEAGSGAEKPVPDEMISTIRETVKIPLIVGGGIRDAKTAREKIEAGADAIVNGTLGEAHSARIREIIDAIKNQ